MDNALCQVENNSPITILGCASNSFINTGTECMSKLGLIKQVAEVDRNDNQIGKDSVLKDYSTVFVLQDF